jgi:hypothetical protein
MLQAMATSLRVCPACAPPHLPPVLQALGGLEQLQVAMVRHFEAHADRAGLGLELLPGVRELLQALQARRHAATCPLLLLLG